jgi:phage baseplate assembly protein W
MSTLFLTDGMGIWLPEPSASVAPVSSSAPALANLGPTNGVDFGQDVSTFPVPDTSFATITGFRVLAEALARRLITPRGFLSFHTDYGTDTRLYVNEAIDDAALSRIKAEVAAELRQDERVHDADATVAFDEAAQKLSITCQVLTAAGPFSFVLALSKLSVELYLGTS